jgi:hypothetical protein
MADFKNLVAPFQKAAHLIDSYELVPFEQFAITKKLNQPALPATPDIDLSSGPGLTELISLIPGAGGLVSDLTHLLGDIAKGRLDQVVGDLASLIPATLAFAKQQIGVGLSLVSLLHEFRNLGKVGPAVQKGYADYFISAEGFTTLEDGRIAPPTFEVASVSTNQNPSLAEVAGLVRRFSSHKTADQYIRDLIRVTVEASGDALFDLKRRYQSMNARNDERGKIMQSWFRGFANLAEATTTSAVEEAAQGISSFSTNPLIAASLATFAGTAARKATQNAFLLETNFR